MRITRIFPILLAVLLAVSCTTTQPEQPSADVSAVSEPTNSFNDYQDQNAQNEKEQVPEPRKESEDSAETAGESENAEQKAPLTNIEFKKQVRSMMPWNMKAVMDGNSPLLIIHDLDKNGYEDALVVAVESGEDVVTELSELSKSVRLFQSGRSYSSFMLLIFYQYSGDVVLRYTVPVSQQVVFNGVKPFEVKKGADFPYALEFSFRNRSGIERELVILNGRGITHFTIHENLSEITLIEDIDGDGFRDIIVHEQGFEEGTGFETFLTWYKWNRLEYTEYRNTNIVRNLRQFYIVCAELMRAGDYAEFLEYALDPETYSLLKQQGLSENEIMQRIFYSAAGTDFSGDDNTANGFFTEKGFSAVVFPEIMETPFSYANRNDFRHQVSVRFRPPGGDSRIFLAELQMKKNPFQEKQFCFTIDAFQ